ncbi:MAG: sulfatase-like hydrolase/transferase [Fuerstiella sp.]
MLRPLLILILLVTAQARGAQQLPNIILCMGDDHGWDETGYNGHPHLQTPVLDEMAAEGLKLNRFYAAHPSCSPTRASVVTGRHPNRCGTFAPNYSIRPDEITIAHLLAEKGYRCGHFGKWHLGPVKECSPTSPGAMGFHEWLSHDNFFELNPFLSRNGGPPEKFEGESSEIIVAEAIQFARQAVQQQQPFLLVIWFGSPHEPYSGLPQDLALYDDLPKEWESKKVRLTSNETGRQVQRPLRDVLRERYAEITAMDRSIGQLRTWLREQQIRDDTLLWYCGDNGTSADGIETSPFRGRKGNMYEGGLRVPGVIEWPAQIRAAVASDVPCVTSDILPTLCSVTGATLPHRPLDGVNLKGLIDGQMTDRNRAIGFWSYDAAGESEHPSLLSEEQQRGTTPLVKLMGDIATRNFRNFRHPAVEPEDYSGSRVWLDGDWKLVVNGRRGRPEQFELFNLRADPSEQNNLAMRQRGRVTSMNSELRRWQSSVLNSLVGRDVAP